MSALLRLEGVSIARGGWTILEGLTLSLEPGAVLLVKGPNGIGKTSLLRTIAGLQAPEAGTITRPEDGIAYSAHADALKATMSVTENLSFWASVYGTGDIAPAIDAFNLRPLRRRLVQSLSAGQRRRAGLARLAISGAALWVMDEPTTSLDQPGTALVRDAIKAHTGAGGAAIIATHRELGLEAETLDLSRFRAKLDAAP